MCPACCRSQCGKGPAVRVSLAGDEFGRGQPPAVAAATPRTSSPYRPWRGMGWDFVGNSEISPIIPAGEMILVAALGAVGAQTRRCDTHHFLRVPRLSRRCHPRCHSTCSSNELTPDPCRRYPQNPS